MIAILGKEIKGYLTSMVGYVFIAFLLMVSGIYFTAYHLKGAYPKFAYTLNAVLVVFLIAVPILTMRILAEERKQKTDQLLLTAPVSVTEIVVGKYLALACIFLIVVLVLALYPLILSQFGSIPYGETYAALFGFWLMGCSFLAIGLYISSITESQVIAAVLTFLALFVCYLMEGIAGFFPETSSASFLFLAVLVAVLSFLIQYWTKNKAISGIFLIACEAVLIVLYMVNATAFEGVIQDIFGVFDISGHFSEFASGIFDVIGVVYYLSIIGVFLFLTVESIQKRRWS